MLIISNYNNTNNANNSRLKEKATLIYCRNVPYAQ